MSALSLYKPISRTVIQALMSNNCTCDNWNNIEVKSGFNPQKCRNVHFSGKVKLGQFNNKVTDKSGLSLDSGITNAIIHNCTIGDDVLILNVSDYIANYTIHDNVTIRNCGRISTEGTTSFGNGTQVSVLSETGGRAVRIWDNLSAQQAYIVVLYRHNQAAIKAIEQLTIEYSEQVSSDIGSIGQNSSITNCSIVKDIKVGPYTRIDGAVKLNDGSINSCKEDPVFIGPGVIMDHFIVCSGSSISDSTIIDKCFIGQGCVLGKQYSAENSLFFANCGGFHGEACSIFAGPFTVTHHKSTLLIAALFSFMNAGSGSNQSNHMYKLGPVHQGIVERGSKTTSDSYILWPGHIGPFTLIKGRHARNIDSSSLPFSYLIDSKDDSLIVPGVSLRSIGTIRDAQKWPSRDLRKDPHKIDQINFNLLNPYTVGKMIIGRDLLIKLKNETKAVSGSYSYNNLKIDSHSLERGIQLYQAGIDKFLGNMLIEKLGASDFDTYEELAGKLAADGSHGNGEWVDLAGLFAPVKEIDKFLDEIASGKIASLRGLSDFFEKIHQAYNDWAWIWAAETLEKEEGKPLIRFNSKDVIRIIERWKDSVILIDNLLYDDARKEFSPSTMIGFGIDGSDADKQIDFEQVRGDFESNKVVCAIRDHIRNKSALGDEVIERLKKIEQVS